MFPSLTSMLTWWQWLLLASIPPAIVALYFLKLRRKPLEVPSTYLWHRTLEDMHVNSLWQRLRQNLLMFLQLLLVGILMLACLHPSWHGRTLLQDRLIILIDASASMSATDVLPSRLEQAKRKANDLISRMKPGDAAMIISFSDRARIEQPFTTNQRQLRRRVQTIRPTQRASDIGEALTAAAGLANPGRSGERGTQDAAAAEALPADLFVLSDGGFRSVPEFSWGNLQPNYIPIGTESVSNLAVTAFSAEAHPGQPDTMQALAQIENFGAARVGTNVSLYVDDHLVDAQQAALDPGATQGLAFNFARPDSGVLKVVVESPDALDLDNAAYATVNPPRQAKLLVVTPGNDALETVLSTREMTQLATVIFTDPSSLETDEYTKLAAAGTYDLVIFDRCRPTQAPRANAVYIGQLPPGNDWKQDAPAAAPHLIDTDVSHPLMKYLDLGDVLIAEGRTTTGPPGCRVLLDSDRGALGVIAPRDGFGDVVLGFELIGVGADGQAYANTDWPKRLSFPLFFRNLVQHLGGPGQVNFPSQVRPGDTVTIRTDAPPARLEVELPSGRRESVPQGADAAFLFHATDELGVYRVLEAKTDKPPRTFAVNLFDSVESDLRAKPIFETTWTRVAAQAGFETTRHEAWRWLVLAAILLLAAEWYIYNRRVYL